MTKLEFKKLLAYKDARKRAPTYNAYPKRFVKGAGKGFGFVGKDSRVIPQVGLERYIGNSLKQHSA
jgi:hypothetical protein